MGAVLKEAQLSKLLTNIVIGLLSEARQRSSQEINGLSRGLIRSSPPYTRRVSRNVDSWW